MLSDTEGMLGGETYIKTGDGVPMKVVPSLSLSLFLTWILIAIPCWVF